MSSDVELNIITTVKPIILKIEIPRTNEIISFSKDSSFISSPSLKYKLIVIDETEFPSNTRNNSLVQKEVKELTDPKNLINPLSLTYDIKFHLEHLTKLQKGLNNFMIKLNSINIELNKPTNLIVKEPNKNIIPNTTKIQFIVKSMIFLNLLEKYVSNIIKSCNKHNDNSSDKYFSLEFIFRLLKQAVFYICNVGKDNSLIKEFPHFYTDCLYCVDLIELRNIDDKVNPSFLIGSGGSAKVYLATYNNKRAALKLNQKYTIGDCFSRPGWIKSEISFAQDFPFKYFQQELKTDNLIFSVSNIFTIILFNDLKTNINQLEKGEFYIYNSFFKYHYLSHKKKEVTNITFDIFNNNIDFSKFPSEDYLLWIIRDAFKIMQFIRRIDYQHLDIKPQNLMLNDNFQLRLIDSQLIQSVPKNEKYEEIISHGTKSFQGVFLFPESQYVKKNNFFTIDKHLFFNTLVKIIFQKTPIEQVESENSDQINNNNKASYLLKEIISLRMNNLLIKDNYSTEDKKYLASYNLRLNEDEIIQNYFEFTKDITKDLKDFPSLTNNSTRDTTKFDSEKSIKKLVNFIYYLNQYSSQFKQIITDLSDLRKNKIINIKDIELKNKDWLNNNYKKIDNLYKMYFALHLSFKDNEDSKQTRFKKKYLVELNKYQFYKHTNKNKILRTCKNRKLNEL